MEGNDPAACSNPSRHATAPIPSAQEAAQKILKLVYGNDQKIEKPEFKTSEKRERNSEIYRRYLAGEDSVVLGRVYGLSARRILDIVERERKRKNQ